MKKSFILLTFLTPVLFATVFFVPMLMTMLGDSTQKNIIVVDCTGLYADVLKSDDIYTFTYVDTTPEELKEKNSQNKELTGVLVISEDLATNPKAATIYSEKQINVETKSHISNLLKNYVEEKKLASYNIPGIKEMVEDAKTKIDISTIKWDSDGEEKEGSAELALIIGMVAALLIYMFIVIYGGQVMAGVLQEKTSRIVEVIISSVKPFELMMGKIIGVALVGLTQFMMWVILTLVIYGGATTILAGKMNPQQLMEAQQMAQMGTDGGMADMGQFGDANNIFHIIQNFDFLQIGILFILFFIGGYLLYASLFAAIGSAVDNETDSNQFSMPVTIPIIIALFAGIYASRHPDAGLSFWTSMIPFTSPVVMMARLPFGVPIWQIALSLFILILTFIGSTWFAGKIYRTGILMYGKKVTWKELWKWLKY
jgi:ABC-2 type transport system permease protein